MFEVDDIIVNSGGIEIESIVGTFHESSFIVYINTVEKYAGVSSFDDRSVSLFVDEDTRRYGELVGTAQDSKFTVVRFPDEWIVEASPGRYSVRLIGVRRPMNEENEKYVNVPFLQVG